MGPFHLLLASLCQPSKLSRPSALQAMALHQGAVMQHISSQSAAASATIRAEHVICCLSCGQG
eukprot:2973210-Amphidinium_carterae.1